MLPAAIHANPCISEERGSTERLCALPSGPLFAKRFQGYVADCLKQIFEDYLLGPRHEVRGSNGSVRADLVFRNKGLGWFWDLVMHRYDAYHLVVECKNTDTVSPDDVTQLASYLGKPLGRFGLLVSKQGAPSRFRKRARHFLWGDEKLILHLSVADLAQLEETRIRGDDVNELLSRRYEDLIQAVT